MKIRVAYTVEFSEKAVAAYRKYHGGLTITSELREHIRSGLEDVGRMGVEEQMHEGAQSLAFDGTSI